MLVILSDVDGLYSADLHKDENAKLIERVDGCPETLFALAGGEGSALGTGGMRTKLKAAKLCVENGADMVIANGEDPEILYEIVGGNLGGYTRFFAE